MVSAKEVKQILEKHRPGIAVVDISTDDARADFLNEHADARYAVVYESQLHAAWDALAQGLPEKCVVGFIGSSRVKGSTLIGHSLWFAEKK
jgi:hypothetical protein